MAHPHQVQDKQMSTETAECMVHNTHIMKMLGFVNKLNWHQRINANTSGKESKRGALCPETFSRPAPNP